MQKFSLLILVLLLVLPFIIATPLSDDDFGSGMENPLLETQVDVMDDPAQALKCWTCEDAFSDKHCRKIGVLKQCASNEKSCYHESRTVLPGLKLITKRCKQEIACFNNRIQNDRPAYTPTQCNDVKGSVCRCCCNSNGCNENDKIACNENYPRCERPQVPENGRMICEYDTLIKGSSCRFECLGSNILRGQQILTCVGNLNDGSVHWNYKTPSCGPAKCPLPIMRRVKRECTHGISVGSSCEYRCSKEIYTPAEIMQNHCQDDGSWSSPTPCCKLPCPPVMVMDLTIVLDSSSSVYQHNWDQMIIFVTGIIGNLNLGHNGTLVKVIRYNSQVDETNQLFFDENLQVFELYQKLRTIPYDGSGTETGKALKYVNDVIIPADYNRPEVTDVILILTDGKSQDDVIIPSLELREKSVEMFAIGVGAAVTTQLKDITGSEDKLWAELTEFEALTQDAGTLIGQNICDRSCS